MTKKSRLFSYFTLSSIIVFVSTILLIPIKKPFGFYDEGFAVLNAARIIDGDIPYRDFWAIYPPGQFYSLAGIFKIFGLSLLVSRLYDTIVRLIILFSLWCIAKKITSKNRTYIALISATLLLSSGFFYTYAIFPALALSFLSILSLLKYTDTNQRYWLFMAGILIGFTFFFRWDVGLYVSASIFATISLFYALHISQKAEPTAKITFKLSQIIILAGTALIIILISYGYVGFKSGFENLWEQVVIFPSTTLRNIRSLPYPALLPSKSELLNWLRFYFPLFIYGTAFALYCYNILKKGVIFNTQNFGSIVTAILGLLLFTQAISRYDYIHVIPTSLVAIITAFSLLSQKAFSSANLIIKSARIVMLTFLIVLYIVLPSIMLLNSYTAFSPLKCYSQVEKANCIYLEKDQEQAVEYIREHTVGSDYIFVGNQQHDRIFINDIGFYFLSARQSPSKYSELYPGVATTLPIQQSIIQDIQSHNVEWIVLVNIPESTEPNGSADSSGVTILDDFIQSNYLQVKEFGNYQIWKMATR